MIPILMLSIFNVSAAVAQITESDMIARASRDVIIKWRQTPAQPLDANTMLPEFASKIESIKRALPVSRDSDLWKITVLNAKSADDAAELVQALKFDSRIEYIESRHIRHTDVLLTKSRNPEANLDGVPNDPFYPEQWGLETVDAEAAWNDVLGSPDAVIAVVDIGVAFGHPELIETRWANDAELNGQAGVDDDGNGFIDDIYGYDFVNNDGDPSPNPYEGSQSHGTHVAGIAAATRNNARGIAGIASGCKIMGVRAGAGNSIAYGYEAIYYACRSGAKIINCSWGGDGESAYERDMVNFAISQGCVVVASAGNDNTSQPHYPAGFEGVLSVAATRLGDFHADFTHYGSWVKVSAPGVNILSTIIDDSGQPVYASWQGTSMSAPLVAGICGLVASKYPAMSGREIYSRVISSSVSIDNLNPSRAGQMGLGRVSAWRAVADELSGLRFAGASFEEIAGNGDGRITQGETAKITVSVLNDLNALEGVYGSLSTAQDSVLIVTPISTYGDVPVGGPFANNAPGFQIELPLGSSPGRIVPFSIDLRAANNLLVGRSTFTLYLDPKFAEVNNGLMNLGFAPHGSLGYNDYVNNRYIGPGLSLSSRPANALYHGSFMFAADGYVSDNGYGNENFSREDWVALGDSGAHVVPSTRADLEYQALFDDRGADIFEILFAEVRAAALAWTVEPNTSFLVLEYAITNRSLNPYNDAFAGFFFDWDLGSAGGNLGFFDEANDLAYVTSNVPDYPMIGLASVTDTFSSLHWIDNRLQLDSAGFWTDNRKWNFLFDGFSQAPTVPRDISQWLGVGPFTLDSHASRTVAFAIVTGSSVAELIIAATNARERYQPESLRRVTPDIAVVPKPTLVPNPLFSGEGLKLILPEKQTASVRIHNLLGQVVADFPAVQSGPAGVLLDSKNLPASGLLFYTIETATRETTGKLVILR